MTITSRMLPLNGATQNGWAGPNDNVASRRYYTATAGGFIDATGDPSVDASTLTSQGFVLVGASGPTSSRPTLAGYLKPGFVYVDTTLSLVIVWDGAAWRNPVTGASV